MTAAYFIGTSLTLGWDGVVSTGAYTGTMAGLLGWTATVDGGGGSGFSVAPTFASRLSALLSAAPDVVIVEGGINDGATDITTQALSFFAGIRAGLPQATIYATAAHRVTQANGDGVAAACASVGGTFIDWGDVVEVPRTTIPAGVRWLTGTGNVAAPASDGNRDRYLTADLAHLTHDGYQYVGTRMAQAIRSLRLSTHLAATGGRLALEVPA